MDRSKITRWCRHPQMLLLCSTFALLGACAAVPDTEEWITVGRTTKGEVIERYGQPDLVMASGEEETAIYRSRDLKSPAPHIEIPTIQAGPLGSATTKMEPINPGFATGPSNGSLQKRPERELHIRYNTQGIVQEISR